VRNLSFIHHAIKNAKSEVDFDNKALVQTMLSQNFGIPSLQGEVLFINRNTGNLDFVNQSKFKSKEEIFEKYFVHFPDLIIKVFKVTVVVEIDGDVHWQNNRAIKRTNERNEHYELANIKMLWLTRKEVESKNLLNILHCRLSKILQNEQVRL
jgi:very-short-patch-repair endonuclease